MEPKESKESKEPQNPQESEKIYDVLIVGGGIVGCGLLRDLSLHGLKTLLIDKGDFASQTSHRSSKMLHGGIRYLEQFDFQLVKEALHEKNLWLHLAPHLCQEVSFCLPVYNHSKFPLWMTKIGLFLYDFLSNFTNSPHQILNREKTLAAFPSLKADGLKGSGVYFDAVVDDCKLALESLYDGLLEKHAEAMNYWEVKEFSHHKNYSQVVAVDRLTGEKRILWAKDIVFATGPFTDHLLQSLGLPWEKKLLPSKGIHLWLKKESLLAPYPLVLQTPDQRIIFVIPYKHKILVGTTETQVSEEIFDIQSSPQDIDYLLATLNHYFPQGGLTREHILSTFAGVRPLVWDGGSNRSKTSRVHKIFHPFSNVHVIVGGKLTTFRVMVQELAQMLVTKHRLSYSPLLTKTPLRKKSVVLPFEERPPTAEDIEEILIQEKVRTFEDLVSRRLGFPSKEHWIHNPPFDEYFLNLLPLLKQYLGADAVSQETILHFGREKSSSSVLSFPHFTNGRKDLKEGEGR